MKYELEVYSDNHIGIRKVMDVPLWNNNLIFDDLESLINYITDYVNLSISTYKLLELVKSASMNTIVEFE